MELLRWVEGQARPLVSEVQDGNHVLLVYRGKAFVQGQGDGTPLVVGFQGRESP